MRILLPNNVPGDPGRAEAAAGGAKFVDGIFFTKRMCVFILNAQQLSRERQLPYLFSSF